MNVLRSLKVGAVCVIVACAGCSTSGHFVVPEGSKLYLDGRTTPEKIDSRGVLKTRAFGWSSAGGSATKGIDYRLVEQDGITTKEGKLRSTFRGVSILIPFAIGLFTVPIGLNSHITYNLVNDQQK